MAPRSIPLLQLSIRSEARLNAHARLPLPPSLYAETARPAVPTPPPTKVVGVHGKGELRRCQARDDQVTGRHGRRRSASHSGPWSALGVLLVLAVVGPLLATDSGPLVPTVTAASAAC